MGDILGYILATLVCLMGALMVLLLAAFIYSEFTKDHTKLTLLSREWTCSKQIETTHTVPMMIGKTVTVRTQTKDECIQYNKVGENS